MLGSFRINFQQSSDNTSHNKVKGKGKVVSVNWAPRHEDVLWEWTYSFTHSLTSALDGGECQLHAPAALPPGKEPLVPIG
jgi:hypothetical protein